MDADNSRHYPDVVRIELHHHPREWSNGSPAEVYKFRVIGKAWGGRWMVHAVYANRPAPLGMRLRAMGILKALINSALSEQLGKEVPSWENSLLSWEDH
jgi:hypothetical protein